MKTSRNLLVAGWALLTVAAVGLSWQQYWKAARLEAMLLGRDNGPDLQKRLADAERRNRSLETELDVRREPSAETAAETTPATPVTNEGRGRGRGGPPAAVRAVLDRPELQRLRALQQKAALDARFAPLFKSLNLGADKLDQFKTLLAEKESTMQDVMMAARDQDIDPRRDPDAFRKLVASAQSEIDTQLKSLLGDESYGQYQQYAATQQQRATVEQLRQSLSYTSEPLTDGQVSQLVQILAANAPAQTADAPVGPPPGGGGRGPGGMFGSGGGPTAPITTAALSQAQAVLTTAQFQTLQQMQTLQQAQQQAVQLIRNAENGANASTTSGGTPVTSTGTRGRS